VAPLGDHADPAVLQGVYKRFARHGPWVLNGIDLVLEAGTGTFVTGTNGSGKSTLLRVVAGLSHPTRGTAKRALTASYLPERQPESMRMTGSTYLSHIARMRGMDTESMSSRMRDILERLGLDPGPDVPIGELSKGNRQKVLVAQALLCPVHLIVLDEPFSGLDAPAQSALRQLLAGALESGSAILMSGHDATHSPRDYRAFEMVDGKAIELTHWRISTPSSETQDTMAVTLAGSTALDRLVLASTPGVSVDGESHDDGRDRQSIVAYVDRTETDRFLVLAIESGWSVISVSGADPESQDGHGSPEGTVQ
jgi:ABC-2 type transport system ATP-binding protein